MDTPITVILYTDKKTAEAIFAECRTILSELDDLWSRTKEDSDVGRFNVAQNSIELDPRTTALIEKVLLVMMYLYVDFVPVQMLRQHSMQVQLMTQVSLLRVMQHLPLRLSILVHLVTS